MRLHGSCCLLLALLLRPADAGAIEARPAHTPAFFYHVAGDDPGSWPAILSAAGLVSGTGAGGSVFVLRSGPASLAPQWRKRVRQGAFLILEGDSEIAAAFGFRAGQKRVGVQNVLDHRRPELEIIWKRRLELPVFQVPAQATVFARERWSSAPLVAGFRLGAGAVLWVAASPGKQGHERFPYLLQALCDLGFTPPFRSRRLWAFLDPSYRSRVDLEYFARRWRRAGIAALHVAAWHYFEPDPQRDARLRSLIDQCHRHAIQVYAWLELPHVSEKFWNDHPEWREKTAVGQDAHLDWRKLMNLANPDCAAAVATGIQRLISRFDWDGVNLAELYFESLEGVGNPARFTPMNDDVRAEFRRLGGFDPLELFQPGGQARHPGGLQRFLDYRADLARRLQEHWIGEIERARRRKPHLALVVTHVDDRFDSRMKNLIGADAARLLPLLDRHDFTFLIEDPATVWDRGPERYPEIAKRYQPLTRRAERLAIDINIVERYQDVYPTRQQTGTELLRLVHLASLAFPRVTLYAEHSLVPPDLGLLPSAAAAVRRVEWVGPKLVIESAHGVGVPWQGPARVDGRPWPVTSPELVWLPAGAHALEHGAEPPPLRLLDFNGDIDTALCRPHGIEFAYRASSRAFALIDRPPARLIVDGAPESISALKTGGGFLLTLPRGQHLVSIDTDSGPALSSIAEPAADTSRQLRPGNTAASPR